MEWSKETNENKKQALRSHYLKQRKSFAPEVHNSLSEELCVLLWERLAPVLSSIRFLHTFLPMEEHYEPKLWPLLERLQKEHRHLQLVSPLVRGKGKMEHRSWKERASLGKDRYGILAPIHGEKVEPQALDVVLVPLLVARKDGHRIGYGQGFYDSFLGQCRTDCLSLGLSLFPLLENTAFACDPWDIAVNEVLCVG